MSNSGPLFLTPPTEKEEVYPYRPVWRSVVIESSLIIGVTIAIYVAVGIFGLQVPNAIVPYARLALTILPVAVWVIFSWWAERAALEPRKNLLKVVFISALAANAVGLPLINDFFQVDQWLPLSSAISRIIGYTFTVGLVQELLKYLVVRYMTWPNDFRIRLDGIAYGVASAIGYATILNLHFVITDTPPLDVAALRIFATYAIHIAASAIVGYGLAEVRFGNPTPIFLAIVLALSAFVTGVAIPIRAGLVNAPLSLKASAPQSLYGLLFSVALLAGPLFLLSFLFANAERREREAVAGREE